MGLCSVRVPYWQNYERVSIVFVVGRAIPVGPAREDEFDGQ